MHGLFDSVALDSVALDSVVFDSVVALKIAIFISTHPVIEPALISGNLPRILSGTFFDHCPRKIQLSSSSTNLLTF